MTNQELAAEMRRLADRIEAESVEMGLTLDLSSHTSVGPPSAERVAAVYALADDDMELEKSGSSCWLTSKRDGVKITVFYNPESVEVSASYTIADIGEPASV